MKRLLQIALLLTGLAWCVPAQAQYTSTQVKVTATCVSGASTCAVTVTSTGAHHLLIAGAMVPASVKTISGVTVGACNVTWIHVANSNGGNATTGFNDMYYCTDSASGQTSITITLNATAAGVWDAVIWEATPTGTIAVDSGATPSSTISDAACNGTGASACAGVALTLSANNKYLALLGAGGDHCTNLTGTGFTLDFGDSNGNCIGHGILSTSGAVTSPTTYTQTLSAVFFASAAAFQDTSAAGSCQRSLFGEGC